MSTHTPTVHCWKTLKKPQNPATWNCQQRIPWKQWHFHKPYVKGATDRIARILKWQNITTVFIPRWSWSFQYKESRSYTNKFHKIRAETPCMTKRTKNYKHKRLLRACTKQTNQVNESMNHSLVIHMERPFRLVFISKLKLFYMGYSKFYL